MRPCPTCTTPLVRWPYEGFTIWHCPEGHGKLLSSARIESIKRVRKTPANELKETLRSDWKGDTWQEISCPRCDMDMDKRTLNKAVDLCMDVCRRCDLIWLDAGELEIMQLLYESTDIARDREKFRQRLDNMSPERRARYEDNLSKLPKETYNPADVFGEVLGNMLLVAISNADRHHP